MRQRTTKMKGKKMKGSRSNENSAQLDAKEVWRIMTT
jgi:hypothetical protein